MNWLLLGGWAVGWLLLWRLPRLGIPPAAPAPAAGTGRVSVVIPARNEADRLPSLLGTLARQSHRAHEVVVVDDGSDDGTGQVAQRFDGVRVISAPEVPEGWTGKSWACATGAEAAEGEVIVFLDADVALADDALESLLAEWFPLGGLLSVQPHHCIDRPVEALSLPFNVITMMGIGIGSIVPSRQWAAAGPCMVSSSHDYELAGGHASVRGEVAEDLALAERFATIGLPVRCTTGGARISFRMYRNVREVFEGWAKNVATGARRTPPMRGLATAWWVWAVLSVAMAVVEVAASPGSGGASTAAALYGAVTVQVWVMGRQVGRFGPAALVWPLLWAFFVVVFSWSAVRTLVVRRVTWSGRSIPVAARH